MRIGALDPYEAALSDGSPLALADDRGGRIVMDVRRWLAPPDRGDLSVLQRCVGPVLDIGSGPGRLVTALTARGEHALGVDIAAGAVAHSLRHGGPALRASVFDPLPHEGTWGTAMLIDGNIGIGGDVLSLLRRTREVIRADGRILIETTGSPYQDDVLQTRFAIGEQGQQLGPWFAWAVIGVRALRARAVQAGCQVAGEWSVEGRSFTELRPVRR
jgi:SAM-dependent methyltransferase